MAKYLSAEWMAMAKEKAQTFPEKPGASARMQNVVTGGPDGDIRYYTIIENGKTIEQQLGDDPQADVTMTSTYEDSVKMAQGELDANAAFMQGRVKVSGNMGKVMALMPLTQSPEYKSIQDEIRASTEF